MERIPRCTERYTSQGKFEVLQRMLYFGDSAVDLVKPYVELLTPQGKQIFSPLMLNKQTLTN